MDVHPSVHPGFIWIRWGACIYPSQPTPRGVDESPAVQHVTVGIMSSNHASASLIAAGFLSACLCLVFELVSERADRTCPAPSLMDRRCVPEILFADPEDTSTRRCSAATSSPPSTGDPSSSRTSSGRKGCGGWDRRRYACCSAHPYSSNCNTRRTKTRPSVVPIGFQRYRS